MQSVMGSLPKRSTDCRWTALRASITQFSPEFWKFFAAAFFFDFGIGLYFFLFNLFLTDLHLNERTLGLITGALTLGNVAGTIPVMFMARRFGLQRLLLFSFTATPIICALRTFLLTEESQIGLAFFAGLALCSWPICFSPMIAKLTNEQNRVSGFSICFATGIGLGTLAGLTGGYLPGLLQKVSRISSIPGSIRVVLLLACGVLLLGALPILSLRDSPPVHEGKRSIRVFHPYLLWFLPPFVLWNIVTGSFPPFASVFLQQHLAIPLRHVGAIFSASQLTQFAAVLLAPLVYRRIGSVAGIALAQMATGVALLWMASTRGVVLPVIGYLSYMGFQWMSGPGTYSLLMNHIPEEERSTASAIQNMSGALCQAAAAALTGGYIVRFGYSAVLIGNGGIAMIAALLFAVLLGSSGLKLRNRPATSTFCAGSDT